MNAAQRILEFFKSSRVILATAIVLLGILPTILCSQLFLFFFQTRSVAADVTEMTTNGQILVKQVVTTGYLSTQNADSVEELLEALSLNYDGRIMLVNSAFVIVKDTYNVDKGKTIIWSNVIETFEGSSTYLYDAENAYLVVTVPITADGSDDVIGVLIMNRSMSYLDTLMEYLGAVATIVILVISALSIALALLLSSWFVRPIKAIGDDLHKIEMSPSLQVGKTHSTPETRQVIDRLNTVLTQMRQLDESRQEFVSNVSHELKTPLTSMKVLADSLNSQDDVPVELYREFMQDIAEEIDRETTIINDLLSMVKMDKAGITLNITQANMNELIESILKRLRPIAEKANVELVMESFRPVMVELDTVKISLAITNLVENAIKYNKENGWVHVSLNADHNFCYVKVEDSGMGIPEESIPFIYERFYRVDKSHSREIGGTGLGLAITRNAIGLHGGEIRVQSRLGEGSVFSVRLPLKQSVVEGEA